MRSNYKRLGNYIAPAGELNKGMQLDNLLGISNAKYFQKAKTNTIGINLEKYRIVRKGQFAFNRATTRNGDKISIALREDSDCIVSPSYRIFEVIKTDELIPEYLMMWFRRPEFDRYARYKSHGSAHEFFEYDDMCEIELPIPSIEKQKEIVKEYNTITDRIKLNEQLNKKLEDTAQSIYKEWFVNFEFPDENGNPYKSSGGEMVYCDVLDMEIPIDWESNKLDRYVKLSQGQVINAKTQHLIKDKGLPLLRITDLLNDTQKIFIDEFEVAEKNIARKNDIIYSRTGQVGLVFKNKTGVVYNNCFKVIPLDNKINENYLYWFLKEKTTYRIMVELASGSAQADLAHSAFFSVFFLFPNIKTQKLFSDKIIPIENLQDVFSEQNKILIKLKQILLSKMATIED